MKKILATAIAVVMVLSLASCGASDSIKNGLADFFESIASGLKTDKDDEAVTTESTTAATEASVSELHESKYPDGFDYSSINLEEYITLGKYKGITVTVTTSSDVTDAEIKEYIDGVVAEYTSNVPVTDRASKSGDTVVVDFVGKLNGVAFEGGTGTDTEFVIDVSGLISDFNDGLKGMTAGETKTIDATFPTSYGNEELAGKTVQFEITMKSISETVVPEYNEAFVRENFDFATTAEYEKSVLEILTEQKKNIIEAEKQQGVIDIAVSNAKVIKYPDGLAEDYVGQQIDYVKGISAMYGVDYAAFIEQATGVSAAEYEAQLLTAAEDSVKNELVIQAIAKAEGLVLTEERMAAEIAAFLAYYGVETIDEMCETYEISETYVRNTVAYAAVADDVMNLLVNNATFKGAN